LPFFTYYSYGHSLDGATLFSKVDSNKLLINVKNKMTLIDAKFDADLINISEVTSHKTKWPRFFGPTLYITCVHKKIPYIFLIFSLVMHTRHIRSRFPVSPPGERPLAKLTLT